MKHLALMAAVLTSLFVTGCTSQSSSPSSPFQRPPDLSAFAVQDDLWHGYQRHKFQVDGCDCWLVVPKTPRAGNHWNWSMMFPDAFSDRTATIALLADGYYFAYMSVGDTFGAPSALAHLDAFHAAMVKAGLRPKPVLTGLSRGGLYAYDWAARNPSEVAVIYADAPVCNFASWPFAHDKGGAEGKKLLEVYGFRSQKEAEACRTQPIYELEPIAQAHIPIITVVGDADDLVPFIENSAIVEKEYRKLGGHIVVLHKPGVGHHPHGLEDPTLIVAFIEKHDR